jgi:spore germination cell wall hydrolase CwlJ-like protein
MQIQVRLGATLSNIAQRYGTSVDAIMAANPQIKDKHLIHVGDRLEIPSREGHHAQVAPKPAEDKPCPPASAAPAADKPCPVPGRKTHLTDAEIDLLTRGVAAEARGESPEVWTAVAQACINHARKTGRSIRSVVRSSYLSSNYDGNKVYYTRAPGRIPNWSRMREAVLDAAEGKSRIGNRDHFYDTSIRMPSWGARNTRVQIGDMVFLNAR